MQDERVSTEQDHTSHVSGPRLRGLDAARALALIGMLAVHFGPEDAPGMAGDLYGLGHGRASILFAVVAGAGIALLAGGRGGVALARLRLLSFALVLLPLGLFLQTLDHGIAVILQHYALFFVVGAAVVGWRRRTIAMVAAGATLVGPVLFLAARAAWPDLVDRSSVAFGDSLATIVAGLFLAGPYPLVTWCAPILWGILIARMDLRQRRAPAVLLVIGVVVTIAAIAASQLAIDAFGEPTAVDDWRHLLTYAAHSQMPLWILQAVGCAAIVISLMLMLERSPLGRQDGVMLPLMTLGRYVLSVYVVHLLALHLFRDQMVHDSVSRAAASVLAFSVAAMAIAMVWRRLGRGPVERLLHLPWRLWHKQMAERPDPEPATTICQTSVFRRARRSDPALRGPQRRHR